MTAGGDYPLTIADEVFRPFTKYIGIKDESILDTSKFILEITELLVDCLSRLGLKVFTTGERVPIYTIEAAYKHVLMYSHEDSISIMIDEYGCPYFNLSDDIHALYLLCTE